MSIMNLEVSTTEKLEDANQRLTMINNNVERSNNEFIELQQQSVDI